MAFVQAMFTLFWSSIWPRRFTHSPIGTATRACSQVLPAAGDIEIGADSYKNILAAARFSDKGFFEGDVVIIMDRETEAGWRPHRRSHGAPVGGFVVENGLCAISLCGYLISWILSSTCNRMSSWCPPQRSTSHSDTSSGFLLLQQHGDVRMITGHLHGCQEERDSGDWTPHGLWPIFV